VIYAIFVHETGHLLAMKVRGLRTSGIWFLPFLGAVAVARQPFRSHGETYFVAIAGPIFGLLSLVPLFAASFLLSRNYADAAAWLGYASAAAFINLFNLLPIGVLDGGRIVKSLSMSLSRRLGLVIVGGGLLLCAGLLALAGTSVLGVLLLLSIFELLRSRKMDPLPPMSRKAVLGGTALYILIFILFAFLAIIAAAASKEVQTPGQPQVPNPIQRRAP
jgi:Zn-dependent protease